MLSKNWTLWINTGKFVSLIYFPNCPNLLFEFIALCTTYMSRIYKQIKKKIFLQYELKGPNISSKICCLSVRSPWSSLLTLKFHVGWRKTMHRPFWGVTNHSNNPIISKKFYISICFCPLYMPSKLQPVGDKHIWVCFGHHESI